MFHFIFIFMAVAAPRFGLRRPSPLSLFLLIQGPGYGRF